MTPSEVDAFLAETRTMSMATINHDGTVHLVAMWYGFLEGEIAFETKVKSQKAVNLRRNPTITVMAEDGERYEELRGVQIRGSAELVDDPERRFQLGVSVYERHMGPYDETRRPFVEAMMNNRVVFKVQPVHVASWDHRKL
jgi:PPOX class probable F420-dependent enzyme